MTSTTFIANSESSEQDWVKVITNTAPYPELDVADFRDVMRLDHTADASRSSNELNMARMHLNRQLRKEWAKRHPDLTNPVPGELTDDENSFYKMAVYSQARANLLEKYRDVDTTDRGEARADQMDTRIKTEWRNLRLNIRALIGRSRCDIELI